MKMLRRKLLPRNTFAKFYSTLSSGVSGHQFSVTLEDIEQAHTRVSSLVKPTPLQYSPRLSSEIQTVQGVPGMQIFFKFENKHLTGSFKERGAINKLTQLEDGEKKRGVIAASAGNHAQAVAFHAKRLGIDAKIYMPEATPLAKVSGTLQHGAKVVLHGESLDDAYKEAVRVCEEEGRTFIHPFNDAQIIAGQGTLGLELMEQNPYLDAVVIPIGGGGLIAGTALAMKQVNPRIKIYGVEAENMPGMKKSLEQKQVTKIPYLPTIADGIAVKSVGDLTFQIIKQYVDDIVTVSDDEIANAVLTLLEKEKTLTEGAAAAAYAALAFNKLKLQEKRVCVVLSGGNIDVSVLREIIDRGLVKSSRLCRLRILVPDAPGQLASCLDILARLRANVREVEHERAFIKSPVGYTAIYVTLQTKGPDHIQEIIRALEESKNFIFSFDM